MERGPSSYFLEGWAKPVFVRWSGLWAGRNMGCLAWLSGDPSHLRNKPLEYQMSINGHGWLFCSVDVVSAPMAVTPLCSEGKRDPWEASVSRCWDDWFEPHFSDSGRAYWECCRRALVRELFVLHERGTKSNRMFGPVKIQVLLLFLVFLFRLSSFSKQLKE